MKYVALAVFDLVFESERRPLRHQINKCVIHHSNFRDQLHLGLVHLGLFRVFEVKNFAFEFTGQKLMRLNFKEALHLRDPRSFSKVLLDAF